MENGAQVKKGGGWLVWVVPVCGMLVTTIDMSLFSTYGLLYLELQESSSASDTSLGWLLGIQSLAGFLVSFKVPALIQRFGYRTVTLTCTLLYVVAGFLCAFTPNIYWMYLSYGVIFGSSVYSLEICQFTIVQKSIRTNAVFFTAIATTGYALGDLLWPTLYKVIVDGYGWRGAFLIQSAVMTNCAVLVLIQTAVMQRIPPGGEGAEEETLKGGAKSVDDIDVVVEQDLDLNLNHGAIENINKGEKEEIRIRQPLKFETESATVTSRSHENGGNKGTITGWFPRRMTSLCGRKRWFSWDVTYWDLHITVANFLYALGQAFIQYMIAVRMDLVGLSRNQIVIVMSAGGMVGLLRVLPGYAIDRLELNHTKVAGVFCLLVGATGLVSLLFETFPLMLAYFITFGLLQSVYFTVIAPVFVDVFGRSRINQAMGFRMASFSLSTVLSLPLAGLLLDTVEDINIPIALFGTLQVITAPLIFTIPYCRKQ